MELPLFEKLQSQEGYPSPFYKDEDEMHCDLTPLDKPEFLYAMYNLIHSIGSTIDTYHLISDEGSARIPTLILAQMQRKRQLTYLGFPSRNSPYIDFVIASRRFPMEIKERFVQEHQVRLRQQPLMLVTDVVQSGKSVEQMLGLFHKYSIHCDVSIVTLVQDDGLNLIPPTTTIFLGTRGGIAGYASWGEPNRRWSGVQKEKITGNDFHEKKYFPQKYTGLYDQKRINHVRRQINAFVDYIFPFVYASDSTTVKKGHEVNVRSMISSL